MQLRGNSEANECKIIESEYLKSEKTLNIAKRHTKYVNEEKT